MFYDFWGPSSQYICVIKTNLMNYLSALYFVNQPLYVSGICVYEVKVNQSHYRPEVPRGFQEAKVPGLRDNGPEWW